MSHVRMCVCVQIKAVAEEVGGGPTQFIFLTLDDIRSFPYYDLVQKVRTKESWYSSAEFLPRSPQVRAL